MRITIKKMEVVILGPQQQLLALQTAKVFQRELERISGADVAGAGESVPQKSSTTKQAAPK